MDTIKELAKKYKYEPVTYVEVTGKSDSVIINYVLTYMPKGGFILDYSTVEDMEKYIERIESLIMKYTEYKHLVMNYTTVINMDFKSKHPYSFFITPFHLNKKILKYTNRISSLLAIAAMSTLYNCFKSLIFNNKDIYNYLINNNINTDIGIIKINSRNHIELGIMITLGDEIQIDIVDPLPNARFYYIFDTRCYDTVNIEIVTIGLIHNIYNDMVRHEFIYLDIETEIISRINHDYMSSLVINPKIFLVHSISELKFTSNDPLYYIGGRYLFFIFILYIYKISLTIIYF